MSEVEQIEDDSSGVEAPNVAEVVVTARGGFQSLNGANPAFKKVFQGYQPLADGTAGVVVRVPTTELASVLRSLADLLDQSFKHEKSGQQVVAAVGIDNWTITVQAIKPIP